MKIALLENIHPHAAARFTNEWNATVTTHPGALEGADLTRALSDVHVLGIRSKTHLTRAVLDAAPDLLAIGCYCIGTDQVDLAAARERGIAVFNAPYANTRSVAELVIGEIISLMRRLPEKSAAAHRGEWLKAVDGATEMRGKTLGIIGYGHIGTQLSVLAEALGMRVVFYDIVDKLALGNARKATSLDDLLATSDVVSLHVPATKSTDNMINARTIGKMKRGAYVINASRGCVVDLDALNDALNNGHIAGAAIDVFPVEPHAKGDIFKTPLQGQKNVILTPHIGGSTAEAQENIASDVAEKLVRYMRDGVTDGSVNLPSVILPQATDNVTRFRHIHRNVPGVLAAINNVFSSRNVNIAGQYLQTDASCGYVVIDANNVKDAADVQNALRTIDGTIRAF
jgi:D-3-phosphoglycerate dehydrogenase